MTGFIRSLFGGKAKNPGESDRPVKVQQPPTIERAGGSFYLDPDDAKTYGNIDYMRSAKTVRRTFAKKRGETGEKESIKKVSATEAVKLQESGLPEQPQSKVQPTVQRETPKFDRRRTDTNLDMFRQMAKDMKK
ncbi:MAG TPA: hypothetical protein IGR64_04200 [Leptolyngbyaceae cyanobacterium M65_K2018_010]|nr:hypothetical protein [Leptolyngbyaceae cyanobacterium M65_K2018_010]